MLPPSNSVRANDSLEQIEELGMKAVEENEYLTLYFNEDTFEFAIFVKDSGDIWFSNPVDRENDSIATGVSKDLLSSQISIRYNNKAVQEATMNSAADSVSLGQAEMEKVENGIKVTYTLGKEVSGNMIPNIITIERFESYLEQMDEKDKKLVTSLYKKETKDGTYVLKTASAKFKQKEAETILKAVGYTLEDYIADNEEHDVEGAGGAVFTVPVEYQLDGKQFIARIIMNEVEYTESFPLTQIRFLEFFGAAGSEEEGYIFVPDGSGALIYLNNGKNQSTTYVSKVYGNDESLSHETVTDLNKELSIRLPVYGIKTEDKAMLAIIEDGESYASIYGDVAGKTNSYNTTFSQVNFLPNGKSSLDSMTGSGVLQLYQSKPYDGVYQIRYNFLGKERANYIDMAKEYQSYLIEKEILTEKSERLERPFYLGLIGGVDLTKKLAGIPYRGTEVLTSFAEAQEIIDSLRNDGIDNIKVKYSGWFNDGLNHGYPAKVKTIKKLEKELTLHQFKDSMADANIPVYFDVDFGYVYKDQLFDGFSTNKQSARYFDNNMVMVTNDDLTKKVTGRNGKKATKKYILNTSNLEPLVTKFINQANKKDIHEISLRTITSTISSDFSNKNFVGRQESLNHVKGAINQLVEENIHLMGDNSNAYAFGGVNDIVNVPLHANLYAIIDEAIPFYQLVIQGYIDYAGAPLNLADDYHEELLKSIETGAGLYFEWIAADNSLLKETEYDYLFSVEYKNWYDEAINLYKDLETKLKPIEGKRITDHKKVLTDVYEVEYEDVKLYVNYTEKDVEYNGVKIAARSFAIKENA